MWMLVWFNVVCPVFLAMDVGYEYGGVFGGLKGLLIGSSLASANYFWMTRLLRWGARFEQSRGIPARQLGGHRLAGGICFLLYCWLIVDVSIIVMIFHPTRYSIVERMGKKPW
jgi:hypothetical protein